LAFEEVQVLGVGSKAGSKAELIGIIDDLDAKGKQVLFASTSYPTALEGVEDQLRDRLRAGFVDQLLLPDMDTRRQLVVRKLAERELCLPGEAVDLLARELTGNVRKLEGSVLRLAALIQIENMQPTTNCIRMALEVAKPASRTSALTYMDVIKAVAEEFGVAAEAITGRGRAAPIRKARQLAVALCRHVVGGRLTELGEAFGNRSHATIISILGKISPEYFSDGLESRPVERILFRLGVSIKPQEIIGRQKGLFD
ncbi:MAG: hypothetical protein LIP23_08375, partial [Planctomycetes bacterium]|nr:hypothetical protein [Planctomycetota bacterium]